MSTRLRQDVCWREHDAVAVVLFGVFMASGTLLARMTGAVPVEPGPITPGHLLAMLIPTAFALALTTRRCIEDQCSPVRLFGISDPPREILRGLILGIACVLPAAGLAYLMGVLIMTVTGEPPAPQALMRSLMHEETSAVIAGAALVNAVTLIPLAEEILYRGVLVTVIRRGRGATLTILATAGFFSLLHLSPVHVPSLALLGAGFALAYLITGSLLTSIAMHAAFNAANILLVALQRGA